MRILWRERAIRHLAAIEDYVEQRNPAAARAVQMRIARSVSLLSSHPEMGRPGRVEGTRELVVGDTPYIVAYAIIGDEVRILAVLHGAQRWSDGF